MIDLLPVNAAAVVGDFKADMALVGKGFNPNRFLAVVRRQAFKGFAAVLDQIDNDLHQAVFVNQQARHRRIRALFDHDAFSFETAHLYADGVIDQGI